MIVDRKKKVSRYLKAYCADLEIITHSKYSHSTLVDSTIGESNELEYS